MFFKRFKGITTKQVDTYENNLSALNFFLPSILQKQNRLDKEESQLEAPENREAWSCDGSSVVFSLGRDLDKQARFYKFLE